MALENSYATDIRKYRRKIINYIINVFKASPRKEEH